MTAPVFGTAPNGETVRRVTLERGGARASVMSWGASLIDLRLDGVENALVLGSPTLEPYFTKTRTFGPVVGRVANRLAGGRAAIDGVLHRFERNEQDRNTLHGGSDGAGKSNWALEGHDAASCRLTLRLPDGQAGFPGDLDLIATYRLEADGALTLALEGRTSAPTLCNLAHHAYWNLDGSAEISDHRLTVFADEYLPVDEAKIPLGPPAPVAGTRFDFREARPVILPGDEGLDHNFCLRAAPERAEGPLRPACLLEGANGVRLAVATTEPGLQIYDGAKIDTAPAIGLGGAPYGPRAGLAIEPQRWPDAPNQQGYPSILLRPGEVYRQTSRFHAHRQRTLR